MPHPELLTSCQTDEIVVSCEKDEDLDRSVDDGEVPGFQAWHVLPLFYALFRVATSR